ncbi:MAG: RluA family pseudouridine synthase [Oligoflexia bacterium]|nr:RluA family pseudouridine synthase [Oligoflexia bacterium]
MSLFLMERSVSQPKHHEFLKGPNEKMPLALFLSDRYEGRSHDLLQLGAVYVNQERCLEGHQLVGPDDIVRVHHNPKRYDLGSLKIGELVYYQDENFAVVLKPSGLPVHPTVDNIHENILSFLGASFYLTHRLDVPTSGLMVFAKSKKFQAEFLNLLAERKVKKRYQVLTTSPLRIGDWHHEMEKSKKAPKTIRKIQDSPNPLWQHCHLTVMSSDPLPNGCWSSEIALHTGRTHQIRAQLSYEGFPIVGDLDYGGGNSKVFGLHSCYLSFPCPKTGRVFEFVNRRTW